MAGKKAISFFMNSFNPAYINKQLLRVNTMAVNKGMSTKFFCAAVYDQTFIKGKSNG